MRRQSEALIEGLKRALRSQGISYAELAKRLDLSEASVKRIFSNQTFTLERVEDICDALSISFADLVQIAEIGRGGESHEYTLEQEEFFSTHPRFLAFFDLLLNGKTVNAIKKGWKVSEKDAALYLRKLEALKLLEWLPSDRVKLVASEVRWRKGGPLRRRFLEQAKSEFLKHNFDGDGEIMRFMTLNMSKASYQKARRQLEELAEEWMKSSSLDKQVAGHTDSIGVVLALRPWKFSVLEKLD